MRPGCATSEIIERCDFLIFSSIEFLLWFLPVFLIVYGITPKKYRNLTLLVGSIVFYAMGDATYLALLMISVVVNYFIGLHLAKRSAKTLWRKKILLIAALCGNLAVLFWFKDWGTAEVLPLGISFYTFQILSYLIDVYRGEVVREYSFLKFATYVVMFPKLISGPITRYGEISDSLTGREFTMRGLEDGMKLFILGLTAKVLLADRVGILWHDVQVTGFESISTPLAWLAAIAYSMKIYFDFWGYSLMAVGLGRMLGIELPENFRRPYMARSVRDFYRRWHRTLGQWFCRYVYIPLGGSRRGELRTIFNLFVVWMLTAFWHGASWNFFCWGGLLWICIVLERQLGRWKIVHKMKVLPHIYLWLIIPISWMCFAITDLSQLKIYLDKMLWLVPGINGTYEDAWKALTTYGVLLAVSGLLCTPAIEKLYHRWKDTFPVKVLLAVVFWYCVQRLLLEGNNPFMYFSF